MPKPARQSSGWRWQLPRLASLAVMDLLQETIAKTRYARYLPEYNRREDWEESCWRYINFFAERHPDALTPEVQTELANAMINLEAVGSMRALMTAGEALRLNNVAGFNCAWAVADDLAVFSEVMYILMSGTGQGFSVEREFINNLPCVECLQSDVTVELESPHIVFEDSRKGWATGFRDFLRALWEGLEPTYDLSRLRPKGAVLKTFGGRSSGPEPLRHLLDFVSNLISDARGRRLNTLECHDILCKIAEVVVCGGVRRSALISLSNLSDMRLRDAKTGLWYVGADGKMKCRKPHRQLSNNSVAYTQKPDIASFMREWMALYESKTGERGIFNREAAIKQAARFGRELPSNCGPNPCVIADTWVLTSEGPRQVAELVDKPFTAVVDGKQYYCPTGFFSTGVKNTVKVETDRGYSLTCTPDHKIKLADGEWLPASALAGRDVALHTHEGFRWGEETSREFDLGWVVGLIVGDGCHNPKKYTSFARFWGAGAKDTAEAVSDIVKKWLTPPPQFKGPTHNLANKTWQVTTKALTTLCSKYIEEGSKEFKPELEKQSASFTSGFICGFFDTDGSAQGAVTKGRSVRLSQNSKEKLYAVQRMLSRLGVLCKVYEERQPAGEYLLPDGRGGKAYYKTKAIHELIVSRSSIWVFQERVGFKNVAKANTLEALLSSGKRKPYQDKRETRVTRVSQAKKQEVYDCTVPGPHCFDANGLVAHNCAEILLPSGSMCNLSEAIIREGDSRETIRRKVHIAAIFGTLQASLTDFPFLRPLWKENCEREALLGVSLTGIMDHGGLSGREWSPAVLGAFLEEMREEVRSTNVEWAEKIGINPAASWTCVKPSGTVSQLADTASGIRSRHAPYYLRNIRNAVTDPASQALIDAGVPWEPLLSDPENTLVFTFPVAAPEGATVEADVTAIQQLEHWLIFKESWATHTVSISIAVKEHEWLDVAAWVYRHFDSLTGISFFPYSDGKDDSGNDYPQLPYQTCTKEEYEAAQSKMPSSIDWSAMVEAEDLTAGSQTLACSGPGGCDL